MKLDRRRLAAIAIGSLMLVAACGGPTASADHSPIEVAFFAPFTGPDAGFGPEGMAGCVPATRVINAAGGVIGHPFTCVAVDSRGDPADAVPAATKLVATTSNLVLVMGCTSDEASSVAPIFNAAKIPMFCNTGEAVFDKSPYTYFHRLAPADDYAGYAMSVWAKSQGYTRGVAMFGNDIGSQGTLPTLLNGFQKLGGTMVLSQSLALDQSSYRSEVIHAIAANPQVIFTEADPQTDATYLSEFKQLNHGLVPVVGADPTLDPNWFQAVGGAIGKQDLVNSFVAENPAAATSGPAYDIFKAALMSSPADQVPKPASWSSNPYAEHEFDAVILAALAMTAAKSTTGSVYNSYLNKVSTGGAGSGATQVVSYADGVSALNNGKTIAYVGPGGPTTFDQWGNSAGGFDVDHYDLNGNYITVGHVTAQQVADLIKS